MSKPETKQLRLDLDVYEKINTARGKLSASDYLREILNEVSSEIDHELLMKDMVRTKKLCQFIAFQVSKTDDDLHAQLKAVYKP